MAEGAAAAAGAGGPVPRGMSSDVCALCAVKATAFPLRWRTPFCTQHAYAPLGASFCACAFGWRSGPPLTGSTTTCLAASLSLHTVTLFFPAGAHVAVPVPAQRPGPCGRQGAHERRVHRGRVARFRGRRYRSGRRAGGRRCRRPALPPRGGAVGPGSEPAALRVVGGAVRHVRRGCEVGQALACTCLTLVPWTLPWHWGNGTYRQERGVV